MTDVPSKDLVQRREWDARWARRISVERVDEQSYLDRRWLALFAQLFDKGGGAVLEVGCAESKWLPEFAARWGCQVTGLDYSIAGCFQARARFIEAGVTGQIVCGDLFAPPFRSSVLFDVVISFGVIEHFDPPDAVLKVILTYLRPGGRLLTTVPNMGGAPGWVQRLIDRAIYDEHIRFTCNEFRKLHERAGLDVEFCGPFGTWNPWVVNLSHLKQPWRRIWQAAINRSSRLGWWWSQQWQLRSEDEWWSPYLACIARKSTDAA